MNIVRYPDSRLFKPVPEYTGNYSEIPDLANMMFDLMDEHHGKGLAAQQAGINFRIFVMEKEDKKRVVCVNPVIISFSIEKETGQEGCLSLQVHPKHCPKLERYKEIGLRFSDELGNEQNRMFVGMDAVCVQHEIDHLSGILIHDRIQSNYKKQKFLEKVRTGSYSYNQLVQHHTRRMGNASNQI